MSCFVLEQPLGPDWEYFKWVDQRSPDSSLADVTALLTRISSHCEPVFLPQDDDSGAFEAVFMVCSACDFALESEYDSSI